MRSRGTWCSRRISASLPVWSLGSYWSLRGSICATLGVGGGPTRVCAQHRTLHCDRTTGASGVASGGPRANGDRLRACSLTVYLVIGNVIEPQLLGRRLGLSASVVFFALILWGWIWGPAGMLLSVPLMVVLKILLENSPNYGWLALLFEPGSQHSELAAGTAGTVVTTE